jgi:hypothetical protein
MRVSGSVARRAATGSVGKYSAPCWPQADRPAASANAANRGNGLCAVAP